MCVHVCALLPTFPAILRRRLPLYQETSLTKLSLRAIPALASKIDEWGSLVKSVETTYVTIANIHVTERARTSRSPDFDSQTTLSLTHQAYWIEFF